MLSWSVRRKFFIILFLLIVIVIGAFSAYQLFLKTPPSCFDNKQDGNETGVDCGGSCAKVCVDQVKNPIMRWDPRVFKVTDNNYSVLVYFENPNTNATVQNASYTIHLLNDICDTLATRQGTISIPKHATFAILETGLSLPNPSIIPTRADFSWNGILNWVRDDSPVPDISIDNKTLTNASSSPRIDATVTNNSLTDIPALELTAIVTDGAGNAVGASKTVITNFSHGSTVPIVFTWPEPFVTTQAVCENPVDAVLLIDRSGSMSSVSTNPPEPLTDVKSAAKIFLSALQPQDEASVISFANSASNPPDAPLSQNKVVAQNAIDAINIETGSVQNTNIADALTQAQNILSTEKDSSRKQVIILLTDGVPTLPTMKGIPQYPQIAAQDESRILKGDDISLFAIGLGNQIDSNFLKSIVSNNTNYFQAPDTSTLESIYKSIATQICVKKPAQIDIIPRITTNTSI